MHVLKQHEIDPGAPRAAMQFVHASDQRPHRGVGGTEMDEIAAAEEELALHPIESTRTTGGVIVIGDHACGATPADDRTRTDRETSGADRLHRSETAGGQGREYRQGSADQSGNDDAWT